MSALTNLINAYIKQNNNQEITGPVLNGVLLQMAAAAENVPYIGDNEHWYLYDTETGLYQDTGLPSRGPQGFPGPTGPQGPIGPSGGVNSVNGQQGNVTGLEDTANKVTAMGPGSTDVQYPSAKAVYEAMLTKQGVIDGDHQIPYAYVSGTPAISTNVNVDKASNTKTSSPKSVYDFVVAITGLLANLSTSDKTNLVAAINEAAASGGSPDAVQYTEQTLTAPQKAQARSNIGAVSSNDVSILASGQYVIVASLPTASASTVGKIYLVGPDANDEYDRYVTSFDGLTYSWVPFGTTQIHLDNYATIADLAEMAASLLVDVEEDGFYVVDSSLNIGFSVTEDGISSSNVLPFEIDE